ncbi:MAG: hypothetical protein KDC07_10385, partial [Chitinophagaceae bacterium]|nr:hypothetical protein [Chitinophagaceae bacterium]
MKRLILPLVCICTLLSCAKKQSTDTTTDTTPAYIVAGVKDVHLVNTLDSITLHLEINSRDNTAQEVTIGVDTGLAERLAVSISTKTTTTPFQADIQLKGNLAMPGAFPMYITATNANGSMKKLPFSIYIDSTDGYTCQNYFGTAAKAGKPLGDFIIEDQYGNQVTNNAYLHYDGSYLQFYQLPLYGSPDTSDNYIPKPGERTVIYVNCNESSIRLSSGGWLPTIKKDVPTPYTGNFVLVGNGIIDRAKGTYTIYYQTDDNLYDL